MVRKIMEQKGGINIVQKADVDTEGKMQKTDVNNETFVKS